MGLDVTSSETTVSLFLDLRRHLLPLLVSDYDAHPFRRTECQTSVLELSCTIAHAFSFHHANKAFTS